MAARFSARALRSALVLVFALALFVIALTGAYRHLRQSAQQPNDVSKTPANATEVLDDDDPARQLWHI